MDSVQFERRLQEGKDLTYKIRLHIQNFRIPYQRPEFSISFPQAEQLWTAELFI